MKVRKLKKFVLPTIYTIAIASVFVSIILIGRTLSSYTKEDINSYVVNALLDEETTPVMNFTNDKAVKPYTAEDVVISKNFYEMDADEETQQKSLIYYENTYMQNSGVLYSSENSFDIVAVLDGKVAEIKEDEILGNVLVIDHGNELKSTYQSLNDIQVKVGDEVKQGDIIAQSGENKLNNSSKNSLLFEVYNKGQLINPEKFYEMDLKTLAE